MEEVSVELPAPGDRKEISVPGIGVQVIELPIPNRRRRDGNPVLKDPEGNQEYTIRPSGEYPWEQEFSSVYLENPSNGDGSGGEVIELNIYEKDEPVVEENPLETEVRGDVTVPEPLQTSEQNTVVTSPYRSPNQRQYAEVLGAGSSSQKTISTDGNDAIVHSAAIGIVGSSGDAAAYGAISINTTGILDDPDNWPMPYKQEENVSIISDGPDIQPLVVLPDIHEPVSGNWFLKFEYKADSGNGSNVLFAPIITWTPIP